MDQAAPGGGGGLLSRLRGGDSRAHDEAFRVLLGEHGVRFELDSNGRLLLPAGGPVNRQPASVVQQAATELWEHLGRVLDQCTDDEDLRRIFASIVKRRRTDRLRRWGNRGERLDAVIMGPNTAHPASGTSPTESRAGDGRFERHVTRLLDAAAKLTDEEGDKDAGSRETRRLVELYVIQRLEWAQVAAAMGGEQSVGALKVKFSRLRPRLAEAVYGEFIGSLPAEYAPIARAMLVDGTGIAELAPKTGMIQERVHHIMTGEIAPRLREYFGSDFLQILPRVQRHAPGQPA